MFIWKEKQKSLIMKRFEKTVIPTLKEKLLYNKENNVNSFGLLKTKEVAMKKILFKNTKEVQPVKQIKY